MYLEKKKNTWYAVLTRPVDVWPILGRGRWIRSTKTGDKSTAQIRAAKLVGIWKAEIANARGTLPTPSDDHWEGLRRDYRRAQAADEEGDGEGIEALEVRDIIEASALKIADPEESSRQYRVATGQAAALVPLNPLVTAWKGSLRLAQKTIDQQGRDVQRMADHFKHLDALTPQKIKAWTDTQRANGVTTSSFERIGNGCRSFWSYLQDSGTKSIVDPDPFVGPFRLAQKTAKKTNTGRSGSSYTPEQLTALYVAALSNNDQPLADLIALGAVHFISGLMETGVEFRCCDFPTADRTMIHIYAAMAEHEGRRISERIKAALAAKKARGGALGNPESLKPINGARGTTAAEFAARLQPTISAFLAQNLTQRAIVAELNAVGIKTAQGGEWGLVQLQRVLSRIPASA